MFHQYLNRNELCTAEHSETVNTKREYDVCFDSRMECVSAFYHSANNFYEKFRLQDVVG